MGTLGDNLRRGGAGGAGGEQAGKAEVWNTQVLFTAVARESEES